MMTELTPKTNIINSNSIITLPSNHRISEAKKFSKNNLEIFFS